MQSYPAATPQAQAQQDERERMKQQVKHIKRARKRVILTCPGNFEPLEA
jgi:hypothetical protein